MQIISGCASPVPHQIGLFAVFRCNLQENPNRDDQRTYSLISGTLKSVLSHARQEHPAGHPPLHNFVSDCIGVLYCFSFVPPIEVGLTERFLSGQLPGKLPV